MKTFQRLILYPRIIKKCRDRLTEELGRFNFGDSTFITEWNDGTFKIEVRTGVENESNTFNIRSVFYYAGDYYYKERTTY